MENNMVNIKKLVFLLLLLPAGAFAQAEETLPGETPDTSGYFYEASEEDYVLAEQATYHPPQLKPVEHRSVDGQKWDEASGGLDYSKDLPEPPKEHKQQLPSGPDSGIDWTAATHGLGIFLQVLAVIVAALAIAYGIWRMLQAPRNRVIARDGVEITVDNIDHYLHETDLDRFLREALAQGNYALAVRLYYLQIIKNLSEKNALRWSREKTNRDYLREMRGHPMAEPFREATRLYERAWYGNQALTKTTYAGIEEKMKEVLAGV